MPGAVRNIQLHVRPKLCQELGGLVRGRRLHASTVTCQAPAQPQILYAVVEAASHDQVGHPECAARIPAIMRALEAAQLTTEHRPQQVGVHAYSGPLQHNGCIVLPWRHSYHMSCILLLHQM